jgi:hypothetical protein
VEHAPRNAMADPGAIAHFHDARGSPSRRWELWMDAGQARAVRSAMEAEGAAAQ